MMQQFDHMQKLGKDNMDVAMKTVGTVQKSVQAIAIETADYAKRSFEQGSATLEKLVGARTLDKAVEIQTDYLRQAYGASWLSRPRWVSCTPASHARRSSRSRAWRLGRRRSPLLADSTASFELSDARPLRRAFCCPGPPIAAEPARPPSATATFRPLQGLP
jgi:hypothetical protein